MRRWAGRSAAILGLAAALAGCGSDSRMSGVRGRLSADAAAQLQSLLGVEAEAAPPVPRERLEALGFAVIVARLPAAPGGAPLVALVENRGRVTFVSADRRSITLEGGQVTGTNALGVDLAGYRSDPEVDPVRRPRPPEAWPERLTRVYRFRDAYGRAFSRSAVCLPRVGAETEVEVYGLARRLVAVEEPCRTPAHAFVNRYWVEAGTGRVWKAEQWLGPETGMLSFDVVRPFG